MKLSLLLKEINTKSSYEDRELSAITDDSRKLTPGCLFVCIEGSNFDGHTKAAWALENGALAVMLQKDMGLENQILVDDTRQAYSLACAAFFDNPAKKLKIIGITGTNGKTTTGFILRDLLEKSGHKAGLIGTVKNYTCKQVYDSTLTTPDPFELHSLFREMVDAGCLYCVMEVSSQALDQKRVAGIEFEVGIFTNLSNDHLDYHGSMEAYKASKKLLLKQSKSALINADDPRADFYKEGLDIPVLTFSASSDLADFTAKNIQPYDRGIK